MHYRVETFKKIGRYSLSFAVLGLTASILVLTARNIYRGIKEIVHPEKMFARSSPEQEREYLARENKIYGTIFSVGGLTGLVAGASIGFQKSKSHNAQEENEECLHCHYHI